MELGAICVAVPAFAVTEIVPVAVPLTIGTEAVKLKVPAVCVSVVIEVHARPLLLVVAVAELNVDVLPFGRVNVDRKSTRLNSSH